MCALAADHDDAGPAPPAALLDAISQRAIAFGVAPLVARALERRGGEVPAPLVTVRRAVRARVIAQDHHVARALDALARAGVTPVLYKGSAAAVTLYDDPSLRARTDTDVLVLPAQRAAAHVVLTRLGWACTLGPGAPPRAPGYHAWSYRAGEGPSAAWLDVHVAPADPRRHPVDVAGVVARAQAAAGVCVPSPADAALLIAVGRAVHFFHDDLRATADLHHLVRRAPFAWGDVVSRARDARARTALWLALAQASDLLGTPIPAEVIAALRPPLLVVAALRPLRARPPVAAEPPRAARAAIAVLLADGARHAAGLAAAYLTHRGRRV